MKQDELCTAVIETYYESIYKYCFVTLHYDKCAAQDCTQETFFLLYRKRQLLDLHGNIRVWLYKTADRVMKNYIRKERKYQEQIPLDAVEIADSAQPFFAEENELLSALSPDERSFLLDYYEAGYGGHSLLASGYGMTIRAMYKKIERIKNKLKKATSTNRK